MGVLYASFVLLSETWETLLVIQMAEINDFCTQKEEKADRVKPLHGVRKYFNIARTIANAGHLGSLIAPPPSAVHNTLAPQPSKMDKKTESFC